METIALMIFSQKQTQKQTAAGFAWGVMCFGVVAD